MKKKAKKVYVLIAKRYIEGEKYIALMYFEKYLRKSDISENSKVERDKFLQNGLHERYC